MNEYDIEISTFNLFNLIGFFLYFCIEKLTSVWVMAKFPVLY